MVGKAGMGLGLLSTLLAVGAKLGHMPCSGPGPKSFGGFAALMLLLAIAANTSHKHEE
jgi:hypothetical protein